MVDTWAFTAGMLTEFMSMEHTRATLTSMRLKVGDGLYTNRRRKILTMTEDTSRGDHDTLMAARALLHASFRPRLATTPLRFANPSPPSGWIEDFHLQAVVHARHT